MEDRSSVGDGALQNGNKRFNSSTMPVAMNVTFPVSAMHPTNDNIIPRIPSIKKWCAAGYLCSADPAADLETSTHQCFNCSHPIHCAMWCGKSWMDVLTSTSITLSSLSPEKQETVANGDHEQLVMCHLCIRGIIQGSLAKMTPTDMSVSSSHSLGDIGADAANDDDDDNDNESAISTSPSSKTQVWKLLPPPDDSKCVYWRMYKKFDTECHPEKHLIALCTLCKEVGVHKEICMKNQNTTGLKNHIQSRHVAVFDELLKEEEAQKAKKDNQSKAPIDSFFKPKYSAEDIKRMYTLGVTACIIENSLPMSIVESESFCNMFVPLNKDALKIVNISEHAVRTQTLALGRMAKRATELEMSGVKMAVTTDHWTGADQLTYDAVTGHHIDNDWNLSSVLLDFKVFEGRSTGAKIFEDISSVLDKYKEGIDPAVRIVDSDGVTIIDDSDGDTETTKAKHTIVITDTTGNMGKLGEYLCANNHEHGYCFAHLLHLVAGIAFDRE